MPRFPLLPAAPTCLAVSFACFAPALAPRLRGQAVAYVVVDVRSNDPVVNACQSLQDALTTQLNTVTKNQQDQITLAKSLNRSIGDWGNAGPASVAPVEAAALTLEHTSTLRAGVVFDNQTTAAITGLKTASGQALTMDAADFADFTRFDQTGQQAQTSLTTLAAEIKTTNQEVAATYAAMLAADPGGSTAGSDSSPIPAAAMSQQKYEKLRGKLQALNLHLQGLQAQQRAAFGLLQAQARSLESKWARDAEIAAQVQKANHAENTQALSQLQFDALAWR